MSKKLNGAFFDSKFLSFNMGSQFNIENKKRLNFGLFFTSSLRNRLTKTKFNLFLFTFSLKKKKERKIRRLFKHLLLCVCNCLISTYLSE